MPLIGQIFDATLLDPAGELPVIPGWMSIASPTMGAAGIEAVKDARIRVVADAIAPGGFFKATITYRPHAPTSNSVGVDVPAPLSAWRLDETSGTTAQDAMAANVDGTHGSGVTVNQTGKLVKAARYAAGSAGTSMGDHYGFDGDRPFSFAAWVKCEAACTAGDIVWKFDDTGNGVGWYLRVGGTGSSRKMHFYMFNDLAGSEGIEANEISGFVPDDTWTHVAVAYDGSGLGNGVSMYVNGFQVSTIDVALDTLAGTIVHTQAFKLGHDVAGGNLHIDDAAIFDYELSAAQVALLYAASHTDAISAADYDTAGEHSVLWFDDEHKLFYRFTDSTFVLKLGDEELPSAEVTWDADQELTLEVEHSAVRRKLIVSGTTGGDGTVVRDPTEPIILGCVAFVLGSPDIEETAELVLYDPGITTFCKLARARLLGQFEDPGNLSAIMCILSEPGARFHDVALAVRSSFTVEFGTGDQLDIIGSIVDLHREGFTDERYRTFLDIQIELLLAAAREGAEWTGTGPNLLRIARKFIGETDNAIQLINLPPYALELAVPDLVFAEAPLLLRFFREAVYGGVLGILVVMFGDHPLWDSVEEDVEGGWIWDSVEEDVPGASRWGAVFTTTK